MNWVKENWFKLGILIAILILSASPAYYFGIYLPQKDATAQSAATFQALEAQYQKDEVAGKLQDCLDAADSNYNDLFTEDCKLEGKTDCDTNASVYMSTAEALQKDRDNQKDFCFKQYPQN